MKPHNFQYWTEAVLYLMNCEDLVKYGAASLLHSAISSCLRIHADVLRFPRMPIYPLNLRWYYVSVGEIVSTWNQDPNSYNVTYDEVHEYLLDPLLPTLDERNSIVLGLFAKRFSLLPRTEPVDDSFCIWLFAERILAKNKFSEVLDGSVGKANKEAQNEDLDAWIARW